MNLLKEQLVVTANPLAQRVLTLPTLVLSVELTQVLLCYSQSKDSLLNVWQLARMVTHPSLVNVSLVLIPVPLVQVLLIRAQLVQERMQQRMFSMAFATQTVHQVLQNLQTVYSV